MYNVLPYEFVDLGVHLRRMWRSQRFKESSLSSLALGRFTLINRYDINLPWSSRNQIALLTSFIASPRILSNVS